MEQKCGENVLIRGNRCYRCGYEWVPRQKETPEVCPKCKNPYWNKPKVKNSGRWAKKERV